MHTLIMIKVVPDAVSSQTPLLLVWILFCYKNQNSSISLLQTMSKECLLRPCTLLLSNQYLPGNFCKFSETLYKYNIHNNNPNSFNNFFFNLVKSLCSNFILALGSETIVKLWESMKSSSYPVLSEEFLSACCHTLMGVCYLAST